MPLKFRFKSKDEIPSDHLPFYAERDGGWMLDVDGVVEKSKLDEFRTNNLTLIKERDELKQRFEGIDPDEVRKLADEKRKLEEAQQIKAGEVEKVIETRIKTVKGDYEKQLSAATTERDTLNARLVAIQIDQGIVGVATVRGLRPTAIPDITARARGVFRLVNGVPTAFEADGQTVRAGKDGVTPSTLDDWVEAQGSDAPHLFEPSAGGGATGHTPGGSGHAVKNPFRQETWNLTEQMQLQKKDPKLAQRLKAAA